MVVEDMIVEDTIAVAAVAAVAEITALSPTSQRTHTETHLVVTSLTRIWAT
jgi:hypothetical protein